MNATEAIIECGLTRGRLTATQLFLAEVQKAMDETPKHGRAHRVTRTVMILKDDTKVPYRTFLYYEPGLGYFGVIKDNHGNIILRTTEYCLASTVRQVMMEHLFTVNRGEVNQ
jgi:hypothetical protein